MNRENSRAHFWVTGHCGFAFRFRQPMKLLEACCGTCFSRCTTLLDHGLQVSKAPLLLHTFLSRGGRATMDDFYESAPSPGGSLLSSIYRLSPSFCAVLTLLLAPFAIAIATRLLSGRPFLAGMKELSPFCPILFLLSVTHFHCMSFLLFDSTANDCQSLRSNQLDDSSKAKLASPHKNPEANAHFRDKSPHGIFALYLGSTTHNVISDPALVSS
jgi:hypothetical protein